MQRIDCANYRHVNYLWDDAHADTLDAVGRLVYRSNLLGTDQRITNTGGGNTSSKLMQIDPLSGEPAPTLFVKGSGGDLRTAQGDNFASLYLDKLLQLEAVYNAAAVKGVKTPVEDQMVAMYPHCVFNLNPRASSIDTPLHAFIPAAHVDHTHPNAVIAIAASSHGRELTRQIYGDAVAWVDWQRPGFALGLALRDCIAAKPGIVGIVLGGHGLINWADDDKTCYERSLTLIEMAARYLAERDRGEAAFGGARFSSPPAERRNKLLADILPRLRGLVSQQNRFIATVQHDADTLAFVNSVDAARLSELGTSCPDHFLRTKIKPLYVDWDPQAEDRSALLEKLAAGITQYRSDYAAYYSACQRVDSPPIRDASPTVILIPGLGMVAFGKNKSESRVTAEFYTCAIAVMRGAEAVGSYVALPRQEAFDIEYWALEEAKLRRMPPEKPLARKVVVVVGAGSGIGSETAQRVASEGAHVVCADVNAQAAIATADSLTAQYGRGIGVAGSGISRCGPALARPVDVTCAESIADLLRQTSLAYGGVDAIIVTAGVFITPDARGRNTAEQWRATFDVNVRGGYLVAAAARDIWAAQGLPGALVLTTSVNGVVPKAGSLAYDTSKAAANHLVRELAVDLAPLVRVNGVAPATVVAGSSMFPRERVKNSLRKYKLAFDDDEDTATLRGRLAQFYARRTLTNAAIHPSDQAEVAYLLISDAFSKTTGQIINVDGGLPEAFLR
ncbi:MAG: bifunctional rhamnulose-1-phosphate aldolase/short-chain dehydrogenase [Chloroflexi bacterium]|nr:bifunctional rhamnulose-1-phosphate aldolase/short-chain dehydrogenase [Chloroflexota bacterium]MCY4246752.1 bifunctional rhamnulose-1-phosphate aldolase/short-chain dehydrogenase [Chloroflexota bacterium]